MAFPNVLKIARAHYKDARLAPAGFVTVAQWKDDAGLPIALHVFRLASDDKGAIADARRNFGNVGADCMLIARACYVFDGEEKKRAFSDTDFESMRTQIDLDVLSEIAANVKNILGA